MTVKLGEELMKVVASSKLAELNITGFIPPIDFEQKAVSANERGI